MKKINILISLFLTVTAIFYAEEIQPIKKIVIYGDTRTNHDKHSAIVDLIMKRNPYAVFHVGDLVESGDNPEQWKKFGEIEDKLINKVENRYYPVMGNHDEPGIIYFDKFKHLENKRWYSVDIDNLHFVLLDSKEDITDEALSKEMEWLENELKNISTTGKKVVGIFHHPFYSSYSHGRNNNSPFQLQTLALFEKYKVKNIFNGHVHYYERSNVKGTNYIVTGGGGAPLAMIPPKAVAQKTNPYSIVLLKTYQYSLLFKDKDKYITEVYDIDDKLIDSFYLE